jgi:hypothetical protein
MDDSEDVLAYMAFPAQYRAKLHSTDKVDKLFSAGVAIWRRARPGGADKLLVGLLGLLSDCHLLGSEGLDIVGIG